LQMDIRHFFPSIRAGDALAALGSVIDDIRVLGIYEAFLTDYGKVPIGAGFSAMLANVLLSPLDRIIEAMPEVCRYFRYMDDMVVVLTSKAKARKVREEIEKWLNGHGMTMERKWSVYRPHMHPVNVGGYKARPCGIYPGQRVSRHINRLMSRPAKALSDAAKLALGSLYGWIKTSDSYGFKEKWRKYDGKKDIFSCR